MAIKKRKKKISKKKTEKNGNTQVQNVSVKVNAAGPSTENEADLRLNRLTERG